MDKHELKKNLEEIADNVNVSDLQEETKLSRLFYLQLYSSVLNAEKQNKRREKLLKRKKFISDAKKKVIDGWMDLGKDNVLHVVTKQSLFTGHLLSRSISSTEQDKDVGDIEVHIDKEGPHDNHLTPPLQSVMPDRFDRRMSSGQGGHQGSQRGQGQGPRGQYTTNAIYGSSGGPVYGHNGPVKTGGQGAEYGQGHYGQGHGGGQGQYGQGGYLLGYGGQAGRLAREIETMSASSGSVNARRRNNRGNLEQVAEGESTDSRGEEETRSLSRRNERHRTNSRIGESLLSLTLS